ncbi:MAG: hypothetical protein ACFE9Z_06180 [Promethearchaeota archaeon]
MVKKGKYRLFSFFVENHLIFYKSLKKNNKIIAFAILEYLDFESINFLLNEFLRKQIIHYFSMQLETSVKLGKFLILNFEDDKKENLIKSFSLVEQKLIEVDNRLKFLQDKILEKKFLTYFYQNRNSRTSIIQNVNSLMISGEKKSISLNFFSIALDLIEKRELFVLNFLSLINNIGKVGILNIHFKLVNNEIIKISPYFILKSEENEEISNVEDSLNDFFQCSFFKRENLKINALSNFIWRLPIKDNYFFLEEYEDLFYIKLKFLILEMSKINNKIEKNLKENQIEYVRLSSRLLFIEQSYIFIILDNLNSEYIHRIIEKYYSKYPIYILIINNKDYQKLLNIKSIKLIENVKIINSSEIEKFDYTNFKKKSN